MVDTSIFNKIDRNRPEMGQPFPALNRTPAQMVLNEFPDLAWLKQRVNENFAGGRASTVNATQKAGWPSVILNVKTSNICRDNIRGPLSVFSNLSGESYVEVDKRRTRIPEGCFFVTNHDQHYTLEVGKQSAQTSNIYFGENFIEQVYDSITRSTDQLLERSFYEPFHKINFYNKLNRKTSPFANLIDQIIKEKPTGMLLEEKFYQLMHLLLVDHSQVKKKQEELPAIKKSTKEELLRRLYISTDYIQSSFEQDLSLDEVARIACMSKFHYLRLFKIAFSKTPYQYINDIKVDRAKSLLKSSSLDVLHISRILGFKEASTFSRTFYNSTGVYPTQYRQEVAR